jgi:hypothetical protein
MKKTRSSTRKAAKPRKPAAKKKAPARRKPIMRHDREG